MQHFAEIFVIWGLTAGVCWIVWTVSTNRRRQRVAATQAEMQAKLLDKLSASQDLAEFLKTDSGQKLLTSPPVEAPKGPHSRILGSITAGVILTMLGLALIFLRFVLDSEDDGPIVLGTLALAMGLGFLISSTIAYTLSKSWGLMERPNGAPRIPGA